jgi:hypothetical protein
MHESVPKMQITAHKSRTHGNGAGLSLLRHLLSSGTSCALDHVGVDGGLASAVGDEMKPGDRISLPEAVAKLYAAVEELEKQYERRFTIDGHLMGSIGEVLAREAFKLTLHPPSYKGHDGLCATRGQVEIKITAGQSVAIRDDCNHLIVFKIIDCNEAQLIYDGLGAPAMLFAGKKGSNGQRRIALSRLRQLAEQDGSAEY